MGADFKSREGKYQSSDTLGKTKTRTDERVAGMRKKIGEFRNYFNDNASLYGDEAVSNIFTQMGDATKYLDAVRDSAQSEYDYWSQWETEKDYEDYTRRSTMDIDAEVEDLYVLKEQLKKAEEELADAQRTSMSMPGAATGGSSGNRPAAWDRSQDAQKRVDELKEQIGLKELDIDEAGRIQTGQKYAAKYEWSDFDEWEAKGAAIENPTFTEVEGVMTPFLFKTGKRSKENREAKVGNLVTYSIENQNALMPQSNSDPVDKLVGNYLYTYLEEDEVKLHNAILAKEGKDAAKEFLDYMMPTLLARQGRSLGEQVSAIKNPVAKAAVTGLYGVGTGVDQWASGARQLFSDEVLPTTSTLVASQTIQENLGDTGKLLYGAATTIGNMLPSIILANVAGGIAGGIAGATGATAATVSKAAGTASKVTSALAMGGASAGNTYNQAMQVAAKEGYTRDQAMTYAGLVGASEATLSYLIGGVGNIAGLGEEELLAKVAGLDKAFARLALSGVIRIGGEITEEEVQLWLEPALKSLILNTEFEAPTWQEHVETAIITALSTLVMEGGSVVSTEIDYKKYGEMVLKKHSEDTVIEGALANTKSGSSTHNLAMKLKGQVDQGQKPSASDIGRLYTMYKGGTGQARRNETEANPKLIEAAMGKTPTGAQTQGTTAQSERNETAGVTTTPEAKTAQGAAERSVEEVTAQSVADLAAKSFGSTGQKAFATTLNEVAPDTPWGLFGGFSAYYQAGMTGKDIKAVKSTYPKHHGGGEAAGVSPQLHHSFSQNEKT